MDIRTGLAYSPEVKAKLDGARVTPLPAAYTMAEEASAGRGFSLRASEVTVREILNKVVRKSETKCWVVNRFGANNEFFLINF
jgi:hypothetical protein